LPREVYPYSNEAELIVVHTNVEVGSPAYYALLTGHFQRIIQWFQDRNEKRWVKEGLAELALQLAGLQSTEDAQAYLESPTASLTTWRETETPPHRGAAFLFAAYFHQHFGDEGIRELMSQSLDGIAGFDATLDALGAEQTFEDFFGDWLVANYLNVDLANTSSPYTSAALDLPRPAREASYEQYPVTIEASVQQFGAAYLSLRGDADLVLRFTGTPTVTLLTPSAHSGRYYWWSNRADESMTTLTRAFDFSAIEPGQPITMTYWAWYDVERGYDHVTVEAGTDDDEWRTLLTMPKSNVPSQRWVQEQVDLAPYAGTQVTVAFNYLTDAAITGEGFFVDDIAIPAIGYVDDLESAMPTWESNGFIHSDGQIAQRYLVRLIGLEEENAGVPTIEHLHLDEQGPTEWLVPLKSKGWDEAILVISGLGPLTPHPAHYVLSIVEK
ncbi:MAG TPA: hypothetical protein ENN19_04325, partial [Chloroflexi bacterium]|nr:hypothetical protein [Chloroflexota bacterium]